MTCPSEYAFRMTPSLRFGHLLLFNTGPPTPTIPSSTVSILTTCILITAILFASSQFPQCCISIRLCPPPALLLSWIASCYVMYHHVPFHRYPATLDGHCTLPGREGENEMKR